MCYILKTARLTVSLSLLSCSRLDAATFNTPVIGPDELSVVVAGVLKSRSSLLWPLRGVGSYSEGVNPPPPGVVNGGADAGLVSGSRSVSGPEPDTTLAPLWPRTSQSRSWSWRGDGELFGFMVSVVFLMDRRPNCNLQIFLLDSIDR